MVHVDGPVILASREQRRFVHQVRKIRTREPRGSPGDDAGLHVGVERDLAHVHAQDLLAPPDVGKRDHDLTVEPSRAQQRRVQHIRPVGRSNYDDALVAVEPVHLDEQLIERLLALVMPASKAGATVAADRIDLVDEDDARSVLLRLVEHVAHARGADPDEHLHEIRAGNREERHLGLARDSLGEQRLAGAGRAHHQHPARDLAAELLELRGVAQEVDELANLLLRLLDPSHVGERDLDLILADETRPALAERKRPPAASPTLHLAHEEYPHPDEEQHREPGYEYLHEQALLLGRGGRRSPRQRRGAHRRSIGCRSPGNRWRTIRRYGSGPRCHGPR